MMTSLVFLQQGNVKKIQNIIFWEKPQWGRTSAWCKDLSMLFHKTIMDISWETFLKRMHIHIII